jgi:hypothetical protein
MRRELEWKELEALAAPAGPADWRRVFELVDRGGRYIDRTGEAEVRHEIRGAHKLTGPMADIGWYMSWRANFDDGTRAGRPGSQVPGGNIYGGAARLAVACKVHRQTAKTACQFLRAAGWIRVTRQAGLYGIPATVPNIYQLTIPHLYGEFLARLHGVPGAAAAADLSRGRHARPGEQPVPGSQV